MSNTETMIDHTATTQDRCWGYSAAIDLYDCNPELIRSKSAIEQFVQELLQTIEMKAYGPCQVVHFGDDPKVCGYSMVQLIETSCLSAHFAEESNAVYLDIFSCKAYDAQKAAELASRFFKAKKKQVQCLARR
jgi:S-adenosylmethionine/arginine decarboxylase-like enzyme